MILTQLLVIVHQQFSVCYFRSSSIPVSFFSLSLCFSLSLSLSFSLPLSPSLFLPLFVASLVSPDWWIHWIDCYKCSRTNLIWFPVLFVPFTSTCFVPSGWLPFWPTGLLLTDPELCSWSCVTQQFDNWPSHLISDPAVCAVWPNSLIIYPDNWPSSLILDPAVCVAWSSSLIIDPAVCVAWSSSLIIDPAVW